MSTTDGSVVSGGGGAPGPGGGPGGGGSGGATGALGSSSGVSTATASTGEALKIIKTQLIPHHASHHVLQAHSPLPTPIQIASTPPTTTQTVATAHQQHNPTLSSNQPPHHYHHHPSHTTVHTTHLTTTNAPHMPHAHIQLLKNAQTHPNTFSLNPVAAKIAHVKATTIDGSSGGGTGSSITIGGPAGSGGTIMTSGVSPAGAIKVATAGGTVNTSIGAPIALNVAQSTTATAIRTIGAGGQPTQMRVVMPANMIPAAGRAQITAIPAAAPRTVSNTSITVTRPITQTTYLPRAGVTATPMTGMTTGQRLVTPIRATPASGAGGATVSGLTTAGSFVRGTTVTRNSASPATTVISPATSTTWMQTNTGQVQLIRTIPQQSQKRIITAQGISNAGGVGTAAAVSGTVVATTPPTSVQTGAGQASVQTGQSAQSTIQTVSSQAVPHSQQQQTYVATLATVLPPRQHQATLVYSSNVAPTTSQPMSQSQQFSSAVPAGQRYAVAAPLTATSGTGAAPRQMRPMLSKPFSTTKLNTTSISIRAPNIPQLTSTLATGVSGVAVAAGNTVSAAANSPRSTTMTGVTGSTGNVIPAANLPTTRIIQLQQQPGGTTQQIIGSAGRSMMFQPIIVNAAGSGKIGLRQPVSMTAKVQPSLTITPFGLGKLPSANTGVTGIGQQQQQNVTASIQTITSSGGNVGGTGGSGSSSISTTPTSSVTATNLSTAATAQLVNVSQAAAAAAANQLLTTQNIVSSASGATVVPLAITTRGGVGGNILTGTITPIKNANAITVGKVMAAQAAAQVAAANSAAGDNSNVAVSSGGNSGAPTSVYIHQSAAPQRPHSASSNVSSVSVNSGTPSIVTSSAAGSNTVLTSTSASGAFLPPGSTIYYESVPASSVQVSTGVLSLTTTTVTSSTMSQNQLVSSSGNLAISSLPFASHAPNSTATFTVVPSSGGRTFGQLQIPVSSAGTQIQAVRFSAQLTPSNVANAAADAIAVSQAAPQLMQNVSSQQILIPSQHHGGPPGQHVVIPLQTSIKVTSGGSSGTAVVSNFMRKRDAEGSPIRAAKNLNPTLLAMGANITSAAGSPAASSVGSSFSVASASSSNTSALTAEALAKKDRATASTVTRPSRTGSPASSDGSTTVSANSSPGVEQQMQDGNLVLNHMPGTSDATHFNPINELYSNHHSVASMHHNMMSSGTPVSSRNSSMDHQQQLHATVPTATQRLNGGPIDCVPRKKSRRSTNDSQLSSQSQASLTLPPPSSMSSIGHSSSNSTSNNIGIYTDTAMNAGNGMLMVGGVSSAAASHDGNKENAKPVEFVLRRPRNCTLLNSYKQSWKPANNHFQRYSDVKPREERRPTVIDLANQANVLGKINGWKIFHLRSQMEDLCENESCGYEKLSTMLKQMETHGKNPEIERISELLKGNMQRSKIIVDGINEAQNQIMKIFEHKPHISDIIHRCASKRNFKKREKF